MSLHEDFEKTLQADIDRFTKSHSTNSEQIFKAKSLPSDKKAPSTQCKDKKKPWRSKPKPNHKVTLCVRKKQLAADEKFVHESLKVSKLEAEIEARKAALDAGWPIVTYIIDWESY
ncbi:hypothetical protein ACT3UJ_06335 [Halomonas sp. 86]|uniref:hypothetical protein n=1 Tax=unclassified Halomonas TaxID=2609666 RepID=UPI004033B81B